MQEVEIRIDERLIHSQITTYWTRKLKTTKIIVVDDEAFENTIVTMALKMANPPGVELQIISIEKAAHYFKNEHNLTGSVLIIVKDTKSLFDLFLTGYSFKHVNIGSISKKPASTKVSRSVYLNNKDIFYINNLIKNDVNFTVQMLPDDEIVDLKVLSNKTIEIDKR